MLRDLKPTDQVDVSHDLYCCAEPRISTTNAEAPALIDMLIMFFALAPVMQKYVSLLAFSACAVLTLTFTFGLQHTCLCYVCSLITQNAPLPAAVRACQSRLQDIQVHPSVCHSDALLTLSFVLPCAYAVCCVSIW